jgi:hypothetical protein
MMRFYGEEYSDLKRQKMGNIHIQTIGDLFYVLRECWSFRTAYIDNVDDWSARNPSFGQSAVTCLLVYDMFGGSIHKIFLDNGMEHYFNKIDGHYFDLTSEQFDSVIKYISYDPNKLVERSELCGNREILSRYKLLKEIISAYLEMFE